MSIVGSFGLLGWIPLFIEALLLVQGGVEKGLAYSLSSSSSFAV